MHLWRLGSILHRKRRVHQLRAMAIAIGRQALRLAIVGGSMMIGIHSQMRRPLKSCRLGKSHVGYSRADFLDLGLSVVGGRPGSGGRQQIGSSSLAKKLWNIEDMKHSTERIVAKALAAPAIILLFSWLTMAQLIFEFLVLCTVVTMVYAKETPLMDFEEMVDMAEHKKKLVVDAAPLLVNRGNRNSENPIMESIELR